MRIFRMTSFVCFTAMLLALTAISPALAQYEPLAPPEPYSTLPEALPDVYEQPGEAPPNDGTSPNWWHTCDDSPGFGLLAFVGYDAWRGPVDDSWENNGLHTGLNFGSRLGWLSDYTGIGFQLGGSVGVYDWSGTEYRIARQNEAETQGFLTYGLFRKASEDCRWSASLVQDWMLNSNYGALSQNPTIWQGRWQVGYALRPRHEWGFWGTFAGPTVTRDVPFFGPRTYKSINQLNIYQHHKWTEWGADSWIWFGVPERDRLSGDHSLGDYTVGALANCPLNNHVALYALVTYMHPSSRAGAAGSLDEMWNFSIGLSFFPRPNARSSTVAGQCWMPQLPVANNGTFLVDTNRTY